MSHDINIFSVLWINLLYLIILGPLYVSVDAEKRFCFHKIFIIILLSTLSNWLCGIFGKHQVLTTELC